MCILTGGSARNIGQGIAIHFAKAGANIAVFDLRDTHETVALVEKEGVVAKGWELDASDEKSVSDAIDQVEKTLGPIDILVNVAGITGSRPVFMEHFDNFWRTMRINTGCVRYRFGYANLGGHSNAQSPSFDEGTEERHCPQ